MVFIIVYEQILFHNTFTLIVDYKVYIINNRNLLAYAPTSSMIDKSFKIKVLFVGFKKFQFHGLALINNVH